jgi:soluble lytic murein transglycosylase
VGIVVSFACAAQGGSHTGNAASIKKLAARLAGICLLLALLAVAGYYVVIYIDILRVKWRLPTLVPPAANAHRLDPLLVMSLIIEESGGNYRVRGRAGEIGLMQVTPGVLTDYEKGTGRRVSPEQLFVPETNLYIGCWYLARMLDLFRNEREPVYFALAAYNAGASNVTRWIGKAKGLSGEDFLQRIGFKTTRIYVANIVRRWSRMVERETKSAAISRPAAVALADRRVRCEVNSAAHPVEDWR